MTEEEEGLDGELDLLDVLSYELFGSGLAATADGDQSDAGKTRLASKPSNGELGEDDEQSQEHDEEDESSEHGNDGGGSTACASDISGAQNSETFATPTKAGRAASSEMHSPQAHGVVLG